jgi:DNA replication licensing factor MCM7
MVKTYVRLRGSQRRNEKRMQHNNFGHTTPRTLLGVVRLAQALARLRFSNTVTQEDVDEALRLVEASKESLAADERSAGGRRALNASSRIYNLVKGLADSGACRADDVDADDEEEEEGLGVEMSLRKVKERVIAKGFTETQWLGALEEYTELDVSVPLFFSFLSGKMNGWLTDFLLCRSGKLLAMVRGWCLSRRATARGRGARRCERGAWGCGLGSSCC